MGAIAGFYITMCVFYSTYVLTTLIWNWILYLIDGEDCDEPHI